jgi:hypothetical protein
MTIQNANATMPASKRNRKRGNNRTMRSTNIVTPHKAHAPTIAHPLTVEKTTAAPTLNHKETANRTDNALNVRHIHLIPLLSAITHHAATHTPTTAKPRVEPSTAEAPTSHCAKESAGTATLDICAPLCVVTNCQAPSTNWTDETKGGDPGETTGATPDHAADAASVADA